MALVPSTSVSGSVTATWAAHTPVYTGFTGGVTTLIGRYTQIGNVVICVLYFTGTSNTNAMTATLPVASANDTVLFAHYIQDNGAGLTTPGRVTLNAASAVATFAKDMGGGVFTTSAAKGANVTLIYEV